MGKKKVLSERKLKRIAYPSENDVLCVVQKMLGFDRVLVIDRSQLRNEGILKIE